MVWSPTSIDRSGTWGRIQVVIGGQDVTFFRDVPVQLKNMSWGEPFDDSSMVVEFPQITPFEALGTGDLSWLSEFQNVDVYQVPADFPTSPKVVMWEGMVVSIDEKQDESDGRVSILCTGALFQLDFYVRAPQQIVEPVTVSNFLKAQFSHGIRPHLRTQELKVEGDPSQFTTIRTGSWGPVLTGYIQEELALMLDPSDPSQSQWTIMKDDYRLPVLRQKVRDTNEWTITTGQPGLSMDLKFDATQIENVVYGEGTDEAGTVWRNATRIGLSGDDAELGITVYDPLVIEEEDLYDEDSPGSGTYDNRITKAGAVRVESHYSFGTGITLGDATVSAQQIADRSRYPSFYGTITLKSDPEEGSRLDIRPGENILIKYHRTSGISPIASNTGLIQISPSGAWWNPYTGFCWRFDIDDSQYHPYGYLFHIAASEIDFEDLSVTLTVDTKARDLASLAEVIVRNKEGMRDPAKRLQLGRASGVFDDLALPWDYEAGAGYIPTTFKDWSANGSPSPTTDPSFYAYVSGEAGSDYRDRWTVFPIVAAEKGTIMRTQLTAYDAAGDVLEVPFHMGIYSFQVGYTDMPIDGDGNYNPFFADAWVPIGQDPNLDDSRAETGNDGFTGPHPEFYIIGWGQEGQRAGYWPGLESEGDSPTGVLVDEGTWQFELPRGENVLWVAIYCEQEAWFRGRLIHGVQQ